MRSLSYFGLCVLKDDLFSLVDQDFYGYVRVKMNVRIRWNAPVVLLVTTTVEP